MPSETSKRPQHVAIIMDGNGRWATGRGWPRLVGHRRGAERVRSIVRAAPDLGVRWLTLYAFSTENWKRSAEEVLGLMSLFSLFIQREAVKLNREGVRLCFIGDRSRLSAHLQALMGDIEAQTAGNSVLTLTIALNYGGRDELVRAMRRLAESGADITEEAVSRALDTGEMPDPDLVIRTSGESRVSNFLLWQAAYAEYEFTTTLWPDFTPEELGRILDRFGERDRRYGGAQA